LRTSLSTSATPGRELVTLRELVEEVGADAARFFLLQRSADAQMDFDLDAAASQDPRQNPVSYVQYAHARWSGRGVGVYKHVNGPNGGPAKSFAGGVTECV